MDRNFVNIVHNIRIFVVGLCFCRFRSAVLWNLETALQTLWSTHRWSRLVEITESFSQCSTDIAYVLQRFVPPVKHKRLLFVKVSMGLCARTLAVVSSVGVVGTIHTLISNNRSYTLDSAACTSLPYLRRQPHFLFILINTAAFASA